MGWHDVKINHLESLNSMKTNDYTGWNDKIVAQEKTWFHFRLMKTGFHFFVADHLLVGQLYTNPKSDRSLLLCLKVTQCSRSKIGDALLYNSCSLPIQVITTGPLPAPSKCKSGRFNAWGHSSTHRKTLWGGGAEVPRQEDPDQGVHRKGPVNHWWNSPAAYFVWSYVGNITNMTSHNTKASLIAAIRRVFVDLPPALVEKACSQFRTRIEAVIEVEGGYIE